MLCSAQTTGATINFETSVTIEHAAIATLIAVL